METAYKKSKSRGYGTWATTLESIANVVKSGIQRWFGRTSKSEAILMKSRRTRKVARGERVHRGRAGQTQRSCGGMPSRPVKESDIEEE